MMNQENRENWKRNIYVMGLALGAAFGLITAHLFARAAEENEDGKPPKIATTTLVGLLLSVLSLIRQIAESGKKKK